MNISCDKAILMDALTIVSRGVAAKAVLPALEGIHLQAYENTLKLTGYNLEIGIVTQIPCTIKEEGSMVLQAKILLDIVRRADGNQVTIESGEKYLTAIHAGLADFTILSSPTEDFPQLPDVSETEIIQLDQSALKTAIGQTGFAISLSEDKPVHMGALFQVKDKILTIVAVDGFRLAINRQHIPYEGECSFVIPRSALLEVVKILGDTGEVTLGVGKRHIIFRIGEYKLISRLLEGDFLDYKAAIPQNSSSTVIVNARSLLDSIERIALLINDKIKSPVRMKFSDKELQISCNTTLGKAKDQLFITLTGAETEMGFNHRYLLDALKASGCDEVKLEMAGPLSPMKILPVDGDEFLFLVLPVRLRQE